MATGQQNTSTESGRHERRQSESQVPEWVLAKRGISLLLNNKPQEANDLFLQHPDSLTIYAAYSFATFMEALMTFEEEKLNGTTAVLKEVERKCANEHSGWFKSVKSKMFGSEATNNLANNLETQIILADSQVCIAILTFLQSDISGFLKGGWVLRKSWKLYQNAYNDIRAIYKEVMGDVNIPAPGINSQEQATPGGSTDNSTESSPAESTAHNHFEMYPDHDHNAPSSPTPAPPTTNGYYHNHNNKKSALPYSQSAILSATHQQHQHNNNQTPSSTDDSNTNTTTTDCSSISSGTSTPNSMKNNCSRSSISHLAVDNANFASALKKSISVNSALSKHNKSSSSDSNYWSSKLSPFTSSLSLAYFTSTFHIFSSNDKLKYSDIDKDTVKRLMAAVSFGYGLFQLGISLLPMSLLRLTNFLGFSGNRKNGIECLMYARQGVDMRAPLATLALLWYHTIVRPFYALDGNNVTAGADAASVLLEETEQEYGQSALFLFFRGRVNRLYSDIPMALKYFEMCTDHANQRDLKILAMHEVGWCHLIQLQYCEAENTFLYLRTNSKWSRAFYSYLCGICSGSCANSTNYVYVKEVRANVAKGPRNNQLDELLVRRSKHCPDNEEELSRTSAAFWRLLVYEMLYLWNTLSSCTVADIGRIRDDCRSLLNPSDEPMLGLSTLILGNCYCILREYDLAVESFRRCLAVRKELPYNAEDAHVSAFASYELGELLIKKPETKAEGKSVLHQISHYKDYDFEHRLNVRVHHLLKQL